MSRRFPPPWTVEELDACFVVRDHNGRALAYVHFEDEPEISGFVLIHRGANKQLFGLSYQAKDNHFAIFQQRWRGRL